MTNGSILEETNNFLAFSFLINPVVVFKSYDATKEGGGNRDEMSKCFEGVHQKVQNALSYINRQLRWPIFDRLIIDN